MRPTRPSDCALRDPRDTLPIGDESRPDPDHVDLGRPGIVGGLAPPPPVRSWPAAPSDRPSEGLHHARGPRAHGLGPSRSSPSSTPSASMPVTRWFFAPGPPAFESPGVLGASVKRRGQDPIDPFDQGDLRHSWCRCGGSLRPRCAARSPPKPGPARPQWPRRRPPRPRPGRCLRVGRALPRLREGEEDPAADLEGVLVDFELRRVGLPVVMTGKIGVAGAGGHDQES